MFSETTSEFIPVSLFVLEVLLSITFSQSHFGLSAMLNASSRNTLSVTILLGKFLKSLELISC